MRKRLLALLLAAAALTLPAAAWTAEVDYMEIMLISAVGGDWEMGQYAQFARNEKIDAQGLDNPKVAYEDLFLLARVLSLPQNGQQHSPDWKMRVGEVVLNRVASPDWPDTVAEVIYQDGEWGETQLSELEALLPDRETARIAQCLLEGERVLNDGDVLYAGQRQGGGLHSALYEENLGWTYFSFGNS